MKVFLKQLDSLKKLSLPTGQWAICGSGPLAIRCIRAARDVDIIVKMPLWKELKKKYPIEGPKNNLIRIQNIEIWNDWMGLTNKLDEMIDNSEIIEGFPFVKILYLLEWKNQWPTQRHKDVIDIHLIEKYLEEESLVFCPK